MSDAQGTRYQCPVCKDLVYDNVSTFHDHLNNICSNTLFSKYPGLKKVTFNALWYKLDAMVKEQLIIPSGQKGIHAIIHESNQAAPPPQYYNPNYSHDQSHHPTYNNSYNMPRDRMGGNISGNAMDLEDLDRDIEYLQRTEKERERNRMLQRKRQRHEMEQQISNEVNTDEFTLSMPKLDDIFTDPITEPQNKKRKLLYHNTSDIRPPKRVNIDPVINMQLFQHKIRHTRRLYHNVSYYDFVSASNKHNENKTKVNVDNHSAIIHTQKALRRYLLQCEMLRKCFNGQLFEKIETKEREVYSNNYMNNIEATIKEINVWQNVNDICEEEKDNNKIDVEKEQFLSSWDAIQDQTTHHHLDSLLERPLLSGFYASIDESVQHQNDSDKRHSFWNAQNNVKCGGYDQSMFENAQNKKFIQL